MMRCRISNEDLIGRISSFLPFDEIVNNLRNVNKLWKKAINNSFECWLSVDLTEVEIEYQNATKQSENEELLLKEIKSYSHIVTSLRLSNPENNTSGFLSKIVQKESKEKLHMWNELENIEIYNKSLIIPINNSRNYNIAPFKSLFRLGINDSVLQLLKKNPILSTNCKESNASFKTNHPSLSNSFTDILNYYPFKSVKRMIIDYPISTRELNILRNCFPSLNDIIITRLFHEKRTCHSNSIDNEQEDSEESEKEYPEEFESCEFSYCWDAIYNFLQVIPPNQLRILQFNLIPSPCPKSGKWDTDDKISRIISNNFQSSADNLNSKDLSINAITPQGSQNSPPLNIAEPFESDQVYRAIKRSNREYINNKNKMKRTSDYYSSGEF
ncbi:hypothetical protein HWI79_2116 [Cryptosporidium felis]|nr:hypothetical protein HWI79_2116 [Cryptosporidium felis]